METTLWIFWEGMKENRLIVLEVEVGVGEKKREKKSEKKREKEKEKSK